MTNTQPNIIFILSDQHRAQAMGHLGDENLNTPTMDRMANKGVSFARAYANCPVCTPSRGTIFSGRHAHCGPVSTFTETFKASFPSTAHCLRQAGYHTAYYGKWHCGMVTDQRPPDVRANPENYAINPIRTPERHRAGFQDWFASESGGMLWKPAYYRGREVNPTQFEGYDTDVLFTEAIKYIQDYDRNEPLYMVVSPLAPHFPLDADEKWKHFDPKELKVRNNFRGNELVSDNEMKKLLALYYAMIENLDWNIGRLVETIETTSGFENTLIIYVSDHGDFLGSHGKGTTKIHPHEESTRVPVLFYWPGVIPETGTVNDLFSLVDLQSTILGLVGSEKPSYDQGVNFSSLLKGQDFESPDRVLLEMTGAPHHSISYIDWRGIVTREWKYAMYETKEELLLNLSDDPFETENLAESNPEKTAEMRQMLLEELRKNREPFFDVIVEQGIAPDHPDIDVSLDPDFHGTLNWFYPSSKDTCIK